MKRKRSVRSLAAALLLSLFFGVAGTPVTALAATPLTKENFDAERYAADNPDVKATFGTDKDMLWLHYVRFGVNEKRKVYAINGDTGFLVPNTVLTRDSFDYERYANMYPDVRSAFGLNPDRLWQHYQTFGIREKREAYVIGAGGGTARAVTPVRPGTNSSYACLLDVTAGQVLADRDAGARMNPASMTKILTLLVAAEHIHDTEAAFTITQEMIDYGVSNRGSRVGFVAGETVKVRDLLYGLILPSGADAAMALAIYAGGSHEHFVAMMNAKLQQLGLSGTAHMTNCVGFYHEEHYCTAKDVAVILEETMKNPLCATVLSARTYTTTATPQHPNGIAVKNAFLAGIDSMETKGTLRAAKTGWHKQAGSCAASYLISNSGRHYICVTGNAENGQMAIMDHANLYRQIAR